MSRIRRGRAGAHDFGDLGLGDGHVLGDRGQGISPAAAVRRVGDDDLDVALTGVPVSDVAVLRHVAGHAIAVVLPGRLDDRIVAQGYTRDGVLGRESQLLDLIGVLVRDGCDGLGLDSRLTGAQEERSSDQAHATHVLHGGESWGWSEVRCSGTCAADDKTPARRTQGQKPRWAIREKPSASAWG